jgi:hypothetical protein
VATTGTALAAASIADRGNPSRSEGRTNVVATTGEDHIAECLGRGDVVGAEGIGLVGIGRAHHDDHDLGPAGPQDGGGSEELAQAFLPHEPAHEAHDHLLRRHTERGPGPGHIVRPRRGDEPLEIDAVAQQDELAFGHVQASQHLDVLLALHQLGL